jgi:hypothetical protein
MKKKHKWIHKTICLLLLDAMFFYELGDEKGSFKRLFLIEQYKDLLET